MTKLEDAEAFNGRLGYQVWASKARDDHAVDDCRTVQAGAGDDETVPERVLEAQSPPDEEHNAGRIDDAARQDEPDRHRWEGFKQRPYDDHPAPAYGEIKK